MPWCVGYLIFRIPIDVTRGESMQFHTWTQISAPTLRHTYLCMITCILKYMHSYVCACCALKIVFYAFVHAETFEIGKQQNSSKNKQICKYVRKCV